MSTYVMSDIHGERNRFLRMLKQIDFREEDTLYIIGDVIDRGPDGVALLKDIMKMKNVTMLLGNHEYMCLQVFSPFATVHDRVRWANNGNTPTFDALEKLTKREKAEILAFLAMLDDYDIVTIGSRKFYLVHGWPGESTHDNVWNRPDADAPAPFPDATVIVGHTPVCVFECNGFDDDVIAYSDQLTESGEHFHIFHAENFIDIDCCCGHGLSAGRLACLRLEDMNEFYE